MIYCLNRGLLRFGGKPTCLRYATPKRPVFQLRSLQLSAPQIRAVKGWGTIINIFAGAYIGGLMVSLGLLYFLYHDADERQSIPFELSFKDQITAVKAINKDDVLKSPTFALKHYRRLLIDLAKEEDPKLVFDENDPSNEYKFPIILSSVLVYEKSDAFANFYIDIVLRYAKALLAKGQLDSSIKTLQRIIDDDILFFKLGDSERLSQCCRLLSKVSPDYQQKVYYLERAINMHSLSFPSLRVDKNFLLQDGSQITDEFMSCLNALAFIFAKMSTIKGNNKDKDLTHAMNIYLANLKTLTRIRDDIKSGAASQVNFPLFNCDPTNLIMLDADMKAHISEIMWAKGYRKSAISWAEDVVDEIYFYASNTARAGPILDDALLNLILMYGRLKDVRSKKRCQDLKNNLQIYETDPPSWYDSIVDRFSRIIYSRGPLGIIEKPLLERFGRPTPLPQIQDFDLEDVE
ncbi:uncharacterized protein PRCAT00000650001 [Priceomyces carsonii]|uniref:uncharacterized protein n=1 Tax=Priceomyces carsonii TaxID=28549 RepID=UPI002EDB3909|nr:unnamed protein product [Priceomyces carsonii]